MPSRHILFLVLIIVVAIFFRFWQFDAIPPGLYQDEAMNGADALKTLETGDFRLFYTNNNGREGMIVWLDALAIKLFGTEPWILRVFPAITGVLAVLGLYFLTKELFSVEVALASSFFMATGFWAVNFSRIGFRAGLMVPFLIWSFYFLIRGFNLTTSDVVNKLRCRMSDFIIAGVLFGLGFYTYISYRFAPVLVAAVFIPYLIKYGNKKLWTGFLSFVVAAFIIALPIGLYFLNNSGDFLGRSGQVAIWSAENPLKAAAVSIASTLGMFNIIGDFNWRHNYSGSPELFWPVGILFLLGIYLSFKKFSFSEKFILTWLGIFLLPNILTVEGNPHALRALGAMPAAMIFSGIGLVWLYEKIMRYDLVNFLRDRISLTIFLAIFLFFISFSEYNKYFVRWAGNPKTAEAFSQNQVEISDYLNNLPKDAKKYVIWSADDKPTDNGLPVSAQTVYFLTYGKSNIYYLKANEIGKIELGKKSTIIVPIYFDTDLLRGLQKKYPNSRIEIIELNAGAVVVP
jgi:4-amino-4-deoxy-L-arabinose transferase-like glycosyltransferase